MAQLVAGECSPMTQVDPKLVARGVAVGGVAAYSKIAGALKAGGAGVKLKAAAAAATAATAAAAAASSGEKK